MAPCIPGGGTVVTRPGGDITLLGGDITLLGGGIVFTRAGGDIILPGGDIAFCLPAGSTLRLPANSPGGGPPPIPIPDAGDPVLLGPWAPVHGIGGRALFAGMLFCGSKLNVIGTGPIDVERSYSNRPYIVGGAGRPSRRATNAIWRTWKTDPAGGPVGTGGAAGWRPYIGPADAVVGLGAPGCGRNRLCRPCGSAGGRFGSIGRAVGCVGGLVDGPGRGMAMGIGIGIGAGAGVRGRTG